MKWTQLGKLTAVFVWWMWTLGTLTCFWNMTKSMRASLVSFITSFHHLLSLLSLWSNLSAFYWQIFISLSCSENIAKIFSLHRESGGYSWSALEYFFPTSSSSYFPQAFVDPFLACCSSYLSQYNVTYLTSPKIEATDKSDTSYTGSFL